MKLVGSRCGAISGRCIVCSNGRGKYFSSLARGEMSGYRRLAILTMFVIFTVELCRQVERTISPFILARRRAALCVPHLEVPTQAIFS